MRFALVLGEAANGLRRNASMVVSVILVTFVSLTFVGTAALLQLQIGQMKSFWYDRAQVAVYLCSSISPEIACPDGEATPEQRDEIEAQLGSPTLAPFIDEFYFEDHDQAYANFQEQFEGTSAADYVTPEILNETFWVNLVDPSQSDVLVESFSGVAGVESVTDQRRYLDQIFNTLNAASFTAIGVAVIMLVAAALLIATTIRLSAISRRKELGIMRLVGASNRFIQTPFVLEGVFAALFGSILASGAVVAIAHFFVQGYLSRILDFTSFINVGDALLVVPLLVAVGVVLAAFSANFAISRYLKV
ncbi:permease-like cell division protein FtsX [Agromyces atrinae]|uniref:Cell division protein FtsX n=1 Tax=Agromyces atrinae TaxID=592376 RepID=A0A4Q2M2S3_9MICO|nr:permease-like cell division protein FtsX [Agromyces atrinae]MCI2959112.1 permease-like cell division protein FtsX [Agromyces atrinae]NYD65659.1 cell division transport system permease protein [Agromyces atrinae]RXZ85457.1 FtsX-like permease family protein [Agromyces atrinae]